MTLQDWWTLQKWRWFLWRKHDKVFSTKETENFVRWFAAREASIPEDVDRNEWWIEHLKK